MNNKDLASIEFSLHWNNGKISHTDTTFVRGINFRRDIFPAGLDEPLSRLEPGQFHAVDFAAGTLVQPYSEKRVETFSQNQFDAACSGKKIQPELGRFYPIGFARGPFNCFSLNLTPFRIVAKDQGRITGDRNHPLCTFPVTVQATVKSRKRAGAERGDSCHDIAEMITGDGPGMQAQLSQGPVDFYKQYPFHRDNEEPDHDFYAGPRMVPHLDSCARASIQGIYERRLSPDSRILDLMAGWQSHLPENLNTCQITGLGMNKEELKANPQLNNFFIHDLNADPQIPMETDSVDAAVCTASIEYLTRPLEVLADLTRVIRPKGLCIITFSDRWFPGKEISIWPLLHPFERLGFIADLCRKSGIKNLHTHSIRGYPRPWDDPHIRERQTADPVFAVWGTV